MEPNTQDTLDPRSSTRDGVSVEIIGLTLLAHPDATRVGQVAPLFSRIAGGVRAVNRLEPEFKVLGSATGQPLMSALLSRKPLVIRTTARGALVLDPGEEPSRVLVDGSPLEEPAEFDAARLDRGIVIELGACVLLLLHVIPNGTDEGAPLGLLGDSLHIRELRAGIRRVADQDTCVLITGETGVGKELVAHAIHELSARKQQPFIAVNAAAIPATMAVSALFGHARGAFTGATQRSLGVFGQAEHGTLFLDEIGEIPREVQAMLLRALREREIQPAGENQPQKIDVRVLAATDADLEAMVQRGDFLSPLLRRLEAFTLHVPPLRQRRDDIARLFFWFLSAELRNVGELHKLEPPAPGRKAWLPVSVVAALLEYSWPGNVAELQTVARRIAITNRERKRLQLDAWLAERLPQGESAQVDSVAGPRVDRRSPQSLSDEEIAAAMRRTQFKVVAAAEALGVSRSWLHTRLEFCEGLRKAKDIPSQEITAAAAQAEGSVQRMAELLEVSEHGLKLRIRALGL